MRKHLVFIIVFLLIFVFTPLPAQRVGGWGNGFSSNSEFPSYGIHDAIAEYAYKKLSSYNETMAKWITDWYIEYGGDWDYGFNEGNLIPRKGDNFLAYTDDPDSYYNDWENHYYEIHNGARNGAPSRIWELYNRTVENLTLWITSGMQRGEQHEHMAAYNAGLLTHYFIDITQYGHTDYTEKDHSYPASDPAGTNITYHSYYESTGWNTTALKNLTSDLENYTFQVDVHVSDPSILAVNNAEWVNSRDGKTGIFNNTVVGSTYQSMAENFTLNYDSNVSYNEMRGYNTYLWNMTMENLRSGLKNITRLLYSVYVDAEDNVSTSIAGPLITDIYYDTYLSGEPEEYVRIYNPFASEINISGWSITDQEGTVTFPSNTNTTLYPNDSFYVTKNASAFKEETGRMADFEYGVDSDPVVPQMITSGSLTLSNTGDEVMLKNQSAVVDVVIYDGSTYSGDGWTGPAVDGVSEGSILRRNINEKTREYIDSNTSSDFFTYRHYKNAQSNFDFQNLNINGSITAFVSPDSSYKTIMDEIANANTSVYLNVYEFTNPYIGDALMNASNRGVNVKVLLEGGPVGGVSDDEKYIADKLNDSGAEVGFMINNDTLNIHQRYWADHAKYCIIDNKTIIITSENWAKTGIPTNPTFGNRGWGVVIRNKTVAGYFQDVFFEDFNTSRKDVYLFNASHEKYGRPPEWFEESYTPAKWDYIPVFDNITINGSFNVSPVLAPDTSLLLDSSIIKMIDNAKMCVYVEQLECPKNWTYYGKYHENLYLESVINAARRGASVKIILDSRYNSTNKDNWYCVEYINNIASLKGLNLEAKMAELECFEKIHNKGIIVDNSSIFVGSLNWNYNAVTNNRETGVIIENETIAEYFAEVFFSDWKITKEPHFTFSLKNGWNFITLPLKNSTYGDAEALGGAIPYCTSVIRWDASSQEFDEYDVGSGVGNFSISLGRGYFVYVTNNTNFTISGDRISSVNITVKKGWNSIGWFNPIPTSQGNIIYSIEENAGNCSATAYWNTIMARFVTCPKNINISRFDVCIGGYFIYMDEDGYWSHG